MELNELEMVEEMMLDAADAIGGTEAEFRAKIGRILDFVCEEKVGQGILIKQ